MKKVMVVTLFLCSVFFIGNICSAEETVPEGRYVLKIMNGRAIKNTRVPALVLDSIQGIVWTCPNIIDGKATWIQKDLKSGEEKTVFRKELGIIKQ